jgi:hypothetical protein
MTFTIAHVSDTHLSREKPFFVENFQRVAEHLRVDAPDLVVNTGDISVNGADLRDDLEYARLLHDDLGRPWRAIPGNHDIGDSQEIAKKQPTNAERHARYRAVFGDDWWTLDVPGWRLLAINALLLGSDLPDAQAQHGFIADAVGGLDGRQLLLFLHKPLFIDAPDEAAPSPLIVNAAPRAQLRDALGAVRPRIVCSGHLHEYREHALDGTHYAWAPATAFTVPEWVLPCHGGERMVGYIRLELEPDGSFSSEAVRPAGMATLDLADFPEAYGDLRRIKAALAE